MLESSDERPTPFPVAADLRGILEYVAERLNIGGPGENKLELVYREGRLVKVIRHEFIGSTALAERFG